MAKTIRDLARQLNLSITTVSRALDGYDDVAEATRERVTRAAREIGYTPNRAARQLRRQRTDTIGYILPAREPRFADSFFSEFIAGLGDAAAERNYDLLVSSATPGEASEVSLYNRWVSGRRVDGFILNRMRIVDWRVRFLAASRVPFASLGKSQDEASYPCVVVGNRLGFCKLVRYLIAAGRSRIGFLGANPGLLISAERFGGYSDALSEAGLPLDPQIVLPGDLIRQHGYEGALHLLDLQAPPDAIVCASDLVALGAMAAISERGLQVGKDIAVAGFDNIEEAAHAQTPLTTLAQPVYEIGRMLVKMLVAALDEETQPAPHVEIEPELIVRASTTG